MPRIAISSGHGLHIRGARGNPVPPQLDERDENVKVVDRVATILNDGGVPAVKFHDDVSTSQNANLSAITSWHNKQQRDYDVSVHFNAFDHSAHGTEVLYVSQSDLAARVSLAISNAGNFTNRGAKKNTGLAFLNNTDKPAILIETCFCDNTSDSNKYIEHFEKICQAIAESIAGKDLAPSEPSEPSEPTPPSLIPTPPARPRRGTVKGVAEGDKLNIRASASPSSPVIGAAQNGDVLTIVGEVGDWVRLQVEQDVVIYGWVAAIYVTIED